MNKGSLQFGWRRISQSQVRNFKPWEVSQLKGRITGMQSSHNLQRIQTRLIKTSVVSRKLFLLQGAALRGFTAIREIRAMQPHCLAGGAQKRLTWAGTSMGYSIWFTVKLHSKERVCTIYFVSTAFSVPSSVSLGKTIHYSHVNQTAGIPSSHASTLIGPLCGLS